jgi:hypothetical protein
MVLYFYVAVFALFAVPAAWLELADNGWCSGWRPRRRRGAAAAAGDVAATPHDALSAEPGGMPPASYLAFRRNYVLVFSLMMGERVELSE